MKSWLKINIATIQLSPVPQLRSCYFGCICHESSSGRWDLSSHIILTNDFYRNYPLCCLSLWLLRQYAVWLYWLYSATGLLFLRFDRPYKLEYWIQNYGGRESGVKKSTQQQIFERKRHGVQPQNRIPDFSLNFPKELRASYLLAILIISSNSRLLFCYSVTEASERVKCCKKTAVPRARFKVISPL